MIIVGCRPDRRLSSGDTHTVIEETRAGPVLRVRVNPGAARPSVRLAADRLLVAVKSPPEKGRATEDALRAVAEMLRVPRSAVALATGARSRDKRFLVIGYTASDLRKRIARALGEGAPESVDSP